MQSPWHESPGRRALWLALIGVVVLAHFAVGTVAALTIVGWESAPEPRRIDVALVHELEPAAPPAAPAPVAVPPAPRPVRAAAKPAQGASRVPAPPSSAASAASAELAASAAQAEAEEAASAAESRRMLREQALALAAQVEAAAASTAPAAPAPPAASSGADGAVASASAPARPASGAGTGQPALDWPPSTRLTYTLTGDWGPNHLFGQAVVDWRREGLHYQVELNFQLTSLFEQRMFSDGRIGEQGLAPSRFEQTRRMPLVAPRTASIDFDASEVRLSNGNRVPLLPGTQDSASQFVQFVWMFTAHPERLAPGTLLTFPLALPNSLHMWTYRVDQPQRMDLAFGAIETVHLSPVVAERKSNEYPFEMWIAPTLQYLPVQIRVDLGHDNYAQLTLDRKPLQAAYPNRMPEHQRDDLP